ncbi:Sec-independent protein translocase protein TatB [Alloalcanivorax mobilis]|uniref:Sec-independent protein translocase protein TatB n=1 Tax=Alloalcanivorax mobilis TaxID=2019569 RepID=UPI000B5B10E6|nr:Sec-independent protein translocase protein TatB [Alloalcanivorax mobilis]ASK32973.1 twin-arginine translocase subunit TatB [Alcanivorax sp. N3-2A]ASK36791.1 twin-arginine translocase subunit TatB [Alcanivorax sp. N3-2A]|tara:strand:- start:42986 stop:43417 length:432 start_codon:yes stop_codon:yes gene_type:complete
MFDVGFSELVLVFVIGLLVLGPERLPKAARTVGYWMGRARSTFNHLRNELEREALNQDMRERMEQQMREMGLDEEKIREAKDSLLSPDQIASARRRPHTHEQPADAPAIDKDGQPGPEPHVPTPEPAVTDTAPPAAAQKKHDD